MAIQDFFKSAGEGGCLAMCYVVAALGKNTTPIMLFDVLYTSAKLGIIDVEDYCYVKDAVKLMKSANPSKRYTVTKQKISSLEDLEGKMAAVNFVRGNFNHWVLVDKGQIVFDSLENSRCVLEGVVRDARYISIEDL